MQQFIPFEDDWDALRNLRPEDLIPYRIELLASVTHSTSPTSPARVNSSPVFSPMRAAVPPESSRT